MPRRGVGSPTGIELLGVITSHGPSRESYTSSRKSRTAAEAVGAPTACTALSAQRLQAAFSSRKTEPALLQHRVQEGGTEMVSVEGAAAPASQAHGA